MNKCENCGSNYSPGLPYECSYCKLEVCPDCRLPEKHDCDSLNGTVIIEEKTEEENLLDKIKRFFNR
jgi:hypothetical protein